MWLSINFFIIQTFSTLNIVEPHGEPKRSRSSLSIARTLTFLSSSSSSTIQRQQWCLLNMMIYFHLRMSIRDFVFDKSKNFSIELNGNQTPSEMTRTHNLRGCFDLELFIHGFGTFSHPESDLWGHLTSEKHFSIAHCLIPKQKMFLIIRIWKQDRWQALP